ncbi:hypothetical protein LP417_34040 (plasmid) [Polaromonas sp. P1-6]|nr:hypothetical protein LP417_34040 [Polaromonas sp. P1-6]
MTGNDFYELWEAARLVDKHRKAMGDSGLQQSELVWRKWLAFCAEKLLDWKEAKATDVSAFVIDINPRTTRAGRKVSP